MAATCLSLFLYLVSRSSRSKKQPLPHPLESRHQCIAINAAEHRPGHGFSINVMALAALHRNTCRRHVSQGCWLATAARHNDSRRNPCDYLDENFAHIEHRRLSVATHFGGTTDNVPNGIAQFGDVICAKPSYGFTPHELMEKQAVEIDNDWLIASLSN